MRSFGQFRRVGVEGTGTYGARLLGYLQAAGVEVLEVTTPDKGDRRKRGKNDDLDAQTAAMQPSPASAPSHLRAVTA
jgi:transposase